MGGTERRRNELGVVTIIMTSQLSSQFGTVHPPVTKRRLVVVIRCIIGGDNDLWLHLLFNEPFARQQLIAPFVGPIVTVSDTVADLTELKSINNIFLAC